MSYIIIDLETSISSTVHGPSGVYKENDFYTFICKRPGEEVSVEHRKEGFKRRLPISLDGVKIIVGHNIKFDLLYFWEDEEFQKFLANGGYVYDTQVAEYLITGQQHRMSSLAELQLKYLSIVEKPSRITRLFKKGIGADKIIQKEGITKLQALFHEYSRLDGIQTEAVFLRQYKKAKDDGMWPIIKMYNKYLLVLTMMEHSGMPFNLDLVEKKTREYKLKELEYKQKAFNIAKEVWIDERLPEFNMGSGVHLSCVFFGGSIKVKEKVQAGFFKNGNPKMRSIEVAVEIEGLGFKPKTSWESKKPGIFKTDKDVLGSISKDSGKPGQLASLLLESRVVSKLASTYFPSYLDRQIDGYVHPTYRNTQTITGRLSCTNPNFQNIPKGGEVESLISPLQEGWTCVAIDYSQLEVYILAYLAGCKKLERQITDGLDQHCQSLSYAVKLPYQEVYDKVQVDSEWKEKRKKIGKGITFAMQYGASAATVGRSAGISKEEAQDVIDSYYEEYPEIKNLFDTIREDIEDTKVVSQKINLSSFEHKVSKNGRRFIGNSEILPIKDWDTGDNEYIQDHLRHVGFYRSPTGRKYSYSSDGTFDFKGNVREVFRQPIIQNYASQGTAGDVQCASSVSMFMSLLKHTDKIKLINEIHDSKWFIIKDEYLEALIPKIVWHMEEGVKTVMKDLLGITLDVNLKVDVEVGSNFSEMIEYGVDK